MSDKTIDVRGDRVVKTFTSRQKFIKENDIYKKLKGTGLSPELLDSWDGRLEHAYVQGTPADDLILSLADKPGKLASFFEEMSSWYKTYRGKTNLNLGRPVLEKFIKTETGLIYINFAHCRPGYMEEDLARLAAEMLMMPQPYSKFGLQCAKLFLCIAGNYLDINRGHLYSFIKSETESFCRVRGLSFDPVKTESFATYAVTTGIVIAKSERALEDLTAFSALMPQKIISAKLPVRPFPGFEELFCRAEDPSSAAGISEALSMAPGGWALILDASVDPEETLKAANALLEADKGNSDVFVITAGGSSCPVLLKVESCAPLFKAEAGSEKSIRKLFDKLKVKLVRL